MNTAQLLNDIEQLPSEAQRQIANFIAFIKVRYQYQSVETKPKPEITEGDKSINSSDFVGMWADRPINLSDIRNHAWQRSGSK